MSPAQEAAIRAAATLLHDIREQMMQMRMQNRASKPEDQIEQSIAYAVAQAMEHQHALSLNYAQYQWQEPGPPLSSCLDELAALITTQAPYDSLSVALERARQALEGGV
jgi:hypothetical protein